MKQPNIVYIMVDQLAAKAMSFYGGGVNSSPFLHARAEEGVKFERCYTTFPTCLQNRASMLTSRTPGIHGQISGLTYLRADDPTYAHMLQKAGYHVGGFGKFHRQGTSAPHPRSLSDLGFDECIIVEDDKRGPYLDWIRAKHPEHLPAVLGRLGKFQGHLSEEDLALRAKAREEIFQPLMAEFGYNHMYRSPIPSELHDGTFVTDIGIDYIEKQLQKKGDNPFFCQISYIDPHDPYDPPAEYQELFPANSIPDPIAPTWMEDPDTCLHEISTLNSKAIREQRPELFKQIRSFYHGSIKYLDDQIKRIHQRVAELGALDNTLFIFTSDHGDMMGDHGFMSKGAMHYDGCVRCPLIVWGGGVAPRVDRRMICALDFFPTLMDVAGISADDWPPTEGHSFASSLYDLPEAEHWNEIAIQIIGVRSLISEEGWRITNFLDKKEGQLFNLVEDPDEHNNLYENPKYEKVKTDLLERMVNIHARPYDIPRYSNLYCNQENL